MPPNWNCKLEGSEWVCENDFAAKTKEAIIILTAKEVGATDTLPAYLAHLQSPRALPGRGGAPTKSQIIHVKERMIGNHMWIDGMHLGSEIGPYFTRYLATIKDRIAILVTFSAHKEHYTKYSADFIKAVESLRVVATKDTLAGRGGHDGSGMGGQVGVSPGAVVDYQNELPLEAPPRSGGGGATTTLLGLALLIGAVGFYFFMRTKKKPTKRSSSSSSRPKSK
ncbi:MAG: hypothetical protein KF799_16310 [Bdellovibrionales bacterium]|nr:hypothetical protein [Bdellovibrionales bacterium]